MKFFFFFCRYQEGDNHWSSLLKNQEEYYQTQLNSLHNVLTTTHNALKNVRYCFILNLDNLSFILGDKCIKSIISIEE